MLLDRIFCSIRNFPELSGVPRPDGLKIPNTFCHINFGYQLGRDFFSPSLGLGIVTTFVFLRLGLFDGRRSLVLSARHLCVTLSFLLLSRRSLLVSAGHFGSSVSTCLGLGCIFFCWVPLRR